MALRKEKIVAVAGVQRSGGAGEKEEVLGIRTQEIEIPPCSPAILTLHTLELNLVAFGYRYLTRLTRKFNGHKMDNSE